MPALLFSRRRDTCGEAGGVLQLPFIDVPEMVLAPSSLTEPRFVRALGAGGASQLSICESCWWMREPKTPLPLTVAGERVGSGFSRCSALPKESMLLPLSAGEPKERLCGGDVSFRTWLGAFTSRCGCGGNSRCDCNCCCGVWLSSDCQPASLDSRLSVSLGMCCGSFIEHPTVPNGLLRTLSCSLVLRLRETGLFACAKSINALLSTDRSGSGDLRRRECRDVEQADPSNG